MARSHPVIGVDLGATGIRVVRIADASPKDGVVRIERASHASLPTGAINEGKINNPRNVAAALDQSLQDIKAPRSAPLALAVSGNQAAMTWVNVPNGFRPDERMAFIRSNLEMVGQNVLVSESSLSVVPVAKTAKHTTVAVAAVNRKHLVTIRAILEEVKRNAVVIDLSAAALLRALARPRANDTMALVDIGDTHTVIAMRVGPHLRWVETVPVGGKSVTAALTAATDMNEDDAERAKYSLMARDVTEAELAGALDPVAAAAAVIDDDDADMWDEAAAQELTADARRNEEQVTYAKRTRILTDAVDDLINDIAAAIEARVRVEQQHEPAGVALAGQGALIKGMNARFQDRFGSPVVGALPWAEFDINEYTRRFAQVDPTSKGRKQTYVVPPASQRQFAVAVGMAMSPVGR